VDDIAAWKVWADMVGDSTDDRSCSIVCRYVQKCEAVGLQKAGVELVHANKAQQRCAKGKLCRETLDSRQRRKAGGTENGSWKGEGVVRAEGRGKLWTEWGLAVS